MPDIFDDWLGGAYDSAPGDAASTAADSVPTDGVPTDVGGSPLDESAYSSLPQGYDGPGSAPQPSMPQAAPNNGALSYSGPAQDSQRAYSDGSAFSTQGAQPKAGGALSDPSLIDKIAKGLGLKGDISNPKTMDSWMRFLMGGAAVANGLFGKRNIGYKTPAELRALMDTGHGSFSPQQQQWADSYFNTSHPAGANRARAYAANMPSSVVPGYARGGALGALTNGPSPGGYIHAGTGGQDDVVPINAAGGEYMFDADAVSALGDGNNAAGAAKLDELRRNLREHKRAAPITTIPPRAKAVEDYMPKGALAHLKGAR